jgi:hypothetical protein
MFDNLKEELKHFYGMQYLEFDDGAKGVAQRVGHVLSCYVSATYHIQALTKQEQEKRKRMLEQMGNKAHTVNIADFVEYKPVGGT